MEPFTNYISTILQFFDQLTNIVRIYNLADQLTNPMC